MSTLHSGNNWYDHRPLVAVAPMEAITDRPFRRLVRSICQEVVLFTEFVSASGLLYGGKRVWKMAEFGDEERPLVVQMHDPDPEKLGAATGEIARRLRPDGIDLNMGCPVKKVVRRGAGCGMMADIPNAVEAVKKMIENADGIPVSVKTRLGISSKSEVIELGEALVEAGISQISIHARLKSDRPRHPADWQALSNAAIHFNVPVIGNGDIQTEADAASMVSLPGIDGVMVGRGAIGNPWLLKRIVQKLDGKPVDPLPSKQERILAALQHLHWNVEEKGERKGVLEMRKVFRFYIKGFMDTRKTWMKLIQEETETATTRILEEFAGGDNSPLADLENTNSTDKSDIQTNLDVSRSLV